MDYLDNIISYFKGNPFDEETIKNNFALFLNLQRNGVPMNKQKEDTINKYMAMLIDKYKKDINFYLDVLYNYREDNIYFNYHTMFSRPFTVFNRDSIHSLIFSFIFNSMDSSKYMAEIYKMKSYMNNPLSPNTFKYKGLDLYRDIVESETLLESYNNNYYNEKEFSLDVDDYDSLIQEVYQREIYNKPKDYEQYDTQTILGAYGEYKFLEDLKSQHNKKYKFTWVSKYGNGYGYDLAIENLITRDVMGIEVKTTNSNFNEDKFKLTPREADHLKDEDKHIKSSFMIIRYCVPEGKFYKIMKTDEGYHCIDSNGIEHNIDVIDDMYFTITKNRNRGR